MAWSDDAAYCTRDDCFLVLSPKAFVVRPQPIANVSADVDLSTGVIRLAANGLTSSDYVTLAVTSGGALPTGLSAFTKYPVDPVEFDLIRLRDPDTGDPITSYASAGSGWAIAVDMMRRLDFHRHSQAARINECLTAHEPPLDEPYPPHVVDINARLAVRRMLTSLQFDNAAYRVQAEELRATADQDEATLMRWLAGKPVHPRPVDQTTVADNGARATSSREPSNWTTGLL